MTRALVVLVCLAGASPCWAADGGPTSQLEAAVDGGLGPVPVVDMLDEAMRKLARERNTEALRRLNRKEYPRALKLFREARELDEDSAEIANNLAHINHLLGNYEEAESLYREALKLDPERFVTHLNLADLLGRPGEVQERLQEALRLLSRARELKGNRPRTILRQARVSALAGEYLGAERFFRDYLDLRKPTEKLCIELGDFFRDLGRLDDALSWYRQVDQSEELSSVAAGRIWEIEVERQARKYGWMRRPDTVSAKARMLASRGRVALNKGELDEAERLLAEAVALAPGFALAHADLGYLRSKQGKWQEAEIAYLKSVAIDHSNAEVYARLGKLYLKDSRQAGAAEAALFLSRALELRPDWNLLHLTLAQAMQASGDLAGALGHVRRFLAGTTVRGDTWRQAVLLEKRIKSLLPQEERDGALKGSERGLPLVEDSKMIQVLSRARAHFSRGEPEAALVELKQLDPKDRTAEVFNLEARIFYSSGKLSEATQTLRASLAIDEQQGDVHEQLGVILNEQGLLSEARQHLETAEEQGNHTASYHLAHLLTSGNQAGPFSWVADASRIGALLAARERLDRFLSHGTTTVYREEAQILLVELEDRLFVLFGVLTAVFLLAVIGMAIAGARLWGGDELAGLLRKHPDAGPEVQQVLSAIRHEVLKHNTMVLSGLIEALRAGQGVGEKAGYLRKTLLGNGGQDEAVLDRLVNYAKELERIGRSRKIRLNLWRKDRAISPLFKGFSLLNNIAGFLDEADSLNTGEKDRLLKTLNRAARLINTDGYAAVHRLLDSMRLLEIDEPFLCSIFERVRSEPAFTSIKIDALVLAVNTSLPCRVPLPRQAFEDILANLLRNALQSSTSELDDPARVGLEVHDELDPITGLERVVFLVRDRSAQVLTNEMLHGRDVVDGLGLTEELISKYDGTLDLLPGESGWSKAVRVKLPMSTSGNTGQVLLQ